MKIKDIKVGDIVYSKYWPSHYKVLEIEGNCIYVVNTCSKITRYMGVPQLRRYYKIEKPRYLL